jgi:hypothetical protein
MTFAPRVLDVAVMGVVSEGAHGQLRHVQLAEHYRAASRRRATAVHSKGEVKYSRVRVPQEVGRPGTWQRSL